MLQLMNDSGFAAMFFASPDPDGVDSLYTVVKGTFRIGSAVVRAPEQVPVTLADEHHGDPAATSVRVPSDISLVKPGTDVVLLGSAHAPDHRPVTWLDVTLVAGPLQKSVRVFGDRVWNAAGLARGISAPQPFTVMPLLWERAFGGTMLSGAKVQGDSRNPVGAGFYRSGADTPLHGLPLPNLEDPAQPITAPSDAPPPAGFAPVGAHWLPRLTFAGTYDEQWQRSRAPFLPTDFDTRFFNIAPPGLTSPAYFTGGEWIQVWGVSPAGVIQFQLPRFEVGVIHVSDGRRETVKADLDTVIIEPDGERVMLVWRSALRCDKRVRKVQLIAIQARDLSRPLEASA